MKYDTKQGSTDQHATGQHEHAQVSDDQRPHQRQRDNAEREQEPERLRRNSQEIQNYPYRSPDEQIYSKEKGNLFPDITSFRSPDSWWPGWNCPVYRRVLISHLKR